MIFIKFYQLYKTIELIQNTIAQSHYSNPTECGPERKGGALPKQITQNFEGHDF